MKKLMTVLPLALLLAYCSGPNNTQTNTDTEMDATSSASTTTTTSDELATTSTDVSDVNTNTTTVTTENMNHSDRPLGTVTVDHSTSVISPIPNDPNDPMYRHWQRTNAQHWTWDFDYPGYDRPTAGSYNAAINGDWQLVMTPELVTAWRTDDSRSLWLREGDTYLSASETFNTRSNLNTGVNASVNTNNGLLNGSATVNGTTSGSVTGSNTNSAATLNGQYSSTYDPKSETYMGNNKTGSVNSSASASASASAGLNNNTSANANTTMNGTTGVDATIGTTGVNSINYNAYNGNMYQMPKFNLYLDNGSFTGYTGCNGISGRVEVTGTSLRFLNTAPSTAIECLGGFNETMLVDMLNRIDSYAYVGDELHLMQGNQVLLKFKKNGQDTILK